MFSHSLIWITCFNSFTNNQVLKYWTIPRHVFFSTTCTYKSTTTWSCVKKIYYLCICFTEKIPLLRPLLRVMNSWSPYTWSLQRGTVSSDWHMDSVLTTSTGPWTGPVTIWCTPRGGWRDRCCGGISPLGTMTVNLSHFTNWIALFYLSITYILAIQTT